MNFLTANIDRAIVMTQYDLRGFAHPLGYREEERHPKSFHAATCNLVAFAAGLGHGRSTDEHLVSSEGSSYKDYLAMCKRLAKDCDLSQREAIQLIIQDIVKQWEEMKVEVADGKREPSAYLQPLKKTSEWGKVVLALAEAFEVKLEQAAA